MFAAHYISFLENMRVETATRLGGVEEYYFSKKLEQIRQLTAAGHDVINLGIGSPDLPPAPEVIEELTRTAADPANHQYQSYRGLPELRNAIADFYLRQYQVTIDPVKEILPMMGSKEAITHISLAFLNPGDQVLIPALGYPTYTSVTKMVEADPIYFPLLEDQNWEPDWNFLENLNTEKVKLMWINYPHMPTGERGSPEVVKRLVQFAKDRGILLCHDNPYSFILNDQSSSIFGYEGAKDCCIELNSLSKTFNMAGWRVGWVVAESEIIQAILQVKSNMDSGMFKPVQMAAVKALSLSQDWYNALNETYRNRLRLVYQLLDELDCQYQKEAAGMFVWARVPAGRTGVAVSDELLEKYHVFITPGMIFGVAGTNYIRVSLCSPEQRFVAAINRIRS
ncbi:MAG: aminotransferase class I/II-fold pyridoxal phosphate-dependent enzyme [Cytophagales bacterium]|nr:aminotransferase class I/II-fold pyridoxal phosphate-dependent enzyme [Cytophagales bacterium]